MSFLAEWSMLVVLMATASASPGPDFVVAVRNSILYSRRTGIVTAVGFGLGVAVHVGYSLAGIAALIAQSVALFTVVKYAGAVYLIWMGWKALRSRGAAPPANAGEAGAARLSDLAALRMGFLTNLLNPKATLFFLAVFTQLVRPDVPFPVQLLYGLTCVAIVTTWFILVATVLTDPRVRAPFIRLSKWVDRLCGALLIALGLRLALQGRMAA